MEIDDEIFSFEKLVVYQKSIDYIDFVYDITNDLPSKENFILTAQFLRAANSISFNIAEGAGDSAAMFNKYLNTSKDSIRECIVCTTVAKRRKYITPQTEISSRKKLTELSKMISGLKKSLK